MVQLRSITPKKIKELYSNFLVDFYLNKIVVSPLIPARKRAYFLQKAGIKVARSATIMADVTFGGVDVEIGERVYINRETFIDHHVRLEDDVVLSSGVRIQTYSHLLGPSTRRTGPPTYAATVVGRGALVYAGALILGGLKVGEGSICAAGSVVTKDVQPNVLVAGVPAKVVKELP